VSTPLGVRICGQLGCSRRTHVTETGIHYSRCIAHTLMLLSGVFAVQPPARARVSTPPSVTRALAAGSPVAASGSRSRG
jgi:hypothetical protein